MGWSLERAVQSLMHYLIFLQVNFLNFVLRQLQYSLLRVARNWNLIEQTFYTTDILHLVPAVQFEHAYLWVSLAYAIEKHQEGNGLSKDFFI